MHEDLQIPYQTNTLPTIQLGGILLDGHLLENSPVNLVLKSFNRHGLIAGATGSGKTKTIQVLSEQLSLAGVSCFIMDIKGDISGLAMPGQSNEGLLKRCESLQLTYAPRGFPVEFLTLSENEAGAPTRATISDFGAILFSRMLDLNDTQSGVVTILFEFAKQEQLPLIELSDFKSLLQYAQTEDGQAKIEGNFGALSGATVGTIIRKIIELEAQGGNQIFGEPAFNVQDLIKITPDGLGVISILRLDNMQDKPKVFSSFMLKLLTDVYRNMPELGDPEKPKLILFIDEAHLMFNEASKALLNLMDTMVKLIRSKGIGLIFCTQTPNDIPDSVLGQLGLKIQHSLRAFTAKDRKAMKLVAQNFPESTYYNTEKLLTSLGIGEALLSSLDGKGQPTPLIQCMIRPPLSRMGVLTQQELLQVVSTSSLCTKYKQRTVRQSAKDLLSAPKQANKTTDVPSQPDKTNSEYASEVLNKLSKNTLFRQLVRQFFRQITQLVMSMLGMKKR
ncbi:helicase HerA-like domain-containing protein [Legionella waltersii]|uniref:Putative ATPase n=1 Tax=Legionella waltersii TaxID=66969 RepID=A0A0W1AAZ4_9GAMM|nr:helicase HerA-like domain-containing protein [Legionella waltersii]KTD78456.1 putative ATPase [Legionella waltersii]SNV05953.1 putative ATPase [Legionella waltersii]